METACKVEVAREGEVAREEEVVTEEEAATVEVEGSVGAWTLKWSSGLSANIPDAFEKI